MREVTRDELIAQGCVEKRNQQGTPFYELNGNVLAKGCTVCLVIRDFNYFHKSKRSPINLFSQCKICEASNRELNKERDAQRNTQYIKENLEKVKERRKNYYTNNREKILRKNEEWRKSNSRITYHRNYRKEHKNEISISQRKYRERSYNEWLARYKKWSKENPTKSKMRGIRRRAKESALPCSITPEQLSLIYEQFNNSCALTGESVNLHADHVIPLAVGHVGTTYGNMIPLSAKLNTSKNASHIFEWFEANRERLSLEQAKFDALIAYLAEVNGMNVKEYRAYVDYCFDNPRSLDDLSTEEEDAV